MPVGFGVKQEIKQCEACGGTGLVNHIESEEEISEPYVEENPINYTSDTTLPKSNIKVNYSYKEKFPFKIDYMDDNDEILDTRRKSKNPMNPQTAPAKPQTKPGPDVKPGKPDTDKPSPSKRPFTPPPHITPGEEPNPKARNRKRF
jgi:hypothetical protein